jgi:long-chain acyl-CoA synthetase
VREYSVPATVRVGEEENLVDAVYDNAVKYGGAVAYRRRDAGGVWSDVTSAEFADQVTAVARGLIASGVTPGDRVALLSRTRYEWTLVDYAILAVGGVTVPIYETSSVEQVNWILSDSEAVAIVVESSKHRAAVDSVAGDLPDLNRIWQIEPPAAAPDSPGAVAELTALGSDIPADEVHARRRAVGADDLATLIYTSGTTGRPKGVELTHCNLDTEIKT